MNGDVEVKEIEEKKRGCNCIPKCKQYYRIEGVDVFCKLHLEKLALDILNIINDSVVVKSQKIHRGWTYKQEQELIKFMGKNEVVNGTYRILGERFGKSRIQVKNKVFRLEEAGMLVRRSRK